MNYLLLDKAIEDFYIALDHYNKTIDKILKDDTDDGESKKD